MWSLLVLDLRSVICPLTMHLKSILILLYGLPLFDWKFFFFLMSTKVFDAVTKNDYIITSLSDQFTVGLSSRYNFLSFRYILIFWSSVYNSSWSFSIYQFSLAVCNRALDYYRYLNYYSYLNLNQLH